MGNVSSAGTGGNRRRQGTRRNNNNPPAPPPPPPPQPPQPEITPNRYVFAAATPYPSTGYYQYHPPAPGYYPPPAMPLPAPYDHHHHQQQQANWSAGRYHYGPMIPPPPATPYVEHQKAVTIRNDVNLKKESLRVEPDDQNPGKFLVAFTFDATVAGSITVIFFAKEGEDCNLTPTKENILPPLIVHFEQGLGQKFRQPSGTGIDFSMFEEGELLREGDIDVYPLAIKADACPVNETGTDGETDPCSTNSQITEVVFEKDKGEYNATPTLRFTAIAVLLMACVLAINSENFFAYGQCEGDISGIISQCVKYVRKAGPKTPPSSQCCAVAKKANIPCLCKYVTRDIEQYVSVEKAVYVAQYCGVTFQHGSKCGSYTIP